MIETDVYIAQTGQPMPNPISQAVDIPFSKSAFSLTSANQNLLKDLTHSDDSVSVTCKEQNSLLKSTPAGRDADFLSAIMHRMIDTWTEDPPAAETLGEAPSPQCLP